MWRHLWYPSVCAKSHLKRPKSINQQFLIHSIHSVYAVQCSPSLWSSSLFKPEERVTQKWLMSHFQGVNTWSSLVGFFLVAWIFCLFIIYQQWCSFMSAAGVMLVPERRTEDGFELHFGLNYLGHFLLINLLLDVLKKSGKPGKCSRIVIMSSATHYGGRLTLDDLQGRLEAFLNYN